MAEEALLVKGVPREGRHGPGLSGRAANVTYFLREKLSKSSCSA